MAWTFNPLSPVRGWLGTGLLGLATLWPPGVQAASPAPAAPKAAASRPAPAPEAVPGWTPLADGHAVRDDRTGLVWARCVAGMEWNGSTCTGQPRLMTRGEASAHAGERALAESLGWRLPRVVELQRLVDKNARQPGLPPKVFPAAPADWHWSGTAQVHQTRDNPYNYGAVQQQREGGGGARLLSNVGWAVDLSSAEARGDVAKSTRLPVRLVYTPAPAPSPSN